MILKREFLLRFLEGVFFFQFLTKIGLFKDSLRNEHLLSIHMFINIFFKLSFDSFGLKWKILL